MAESGGARRRTQQTHLNDARPLRIRLTFNDGTAASVDFEGWLSGPVFEPLKDVVYFREFFVDGGTVVWPNGADIAPETLYEAAQASRSNQRMEPARH